MAEIDALLVGLMPEELEEIKALGRRSIWDGISSQPWTVRQVGKIQKRGFYALDGSANGNRGSSIYSPMT